MLIHIHPRVYHRSYRSTNQDSQILQLQLIFLARNKLHLWRPSIPYPLKWAAHVKIFERVISSTLPSPDRAGSADRVQLNDVSYVGYDGGRRVKWQKMQTPHPADALLLVNRRVRAEAKVAWKRVAHTLPCHADIMFAAEADLRPTFLSVYTNATHFDVVHAQIRVVPTRPCLRLKGRRQTPGVSGSPTTTTCRM
ncbi:hypothetical protein MSAN_02239800 [Mycena sanguinolenta]|uniref:Uncharacterized protein n=1 Tax=Mycena sanguinolenta TaxID=230812 RepID=A0A8H7CJH8_9AGAR|nr:hypothetical protein MSAN_02239800 [Mycena sanguinolenta]